MRLSFKSSLSQLLIEYIKKGKVSALHDLFINKPALAHCRIVDSKSHERTLLHIVTDWPGHYPHHVEVIHLLASFQVDINAPFVGPHKETALHWAASNNDVLAIEALLKNGANIEARGGVFYNGTALTNARIFGQWKAAKKLIDYHAKTTIHDEAALGLIDKLTERLATEPITQDECNIAFWNACHGGQLDSAIRLKDAGANIHWIPSWEHQSSYDLALKSGNKLLVDWLRNHHVQSATKFK